MSRNFRNWTEAESRGRAAEFVPRDGQPTTARPGSAEKKAILIQRFKAGENLHHPEDNGFWSQTYG